jgi:hypothetical protein
MYHFRDEVDWTRFFRFDKRWIENMNWARISPAAKAAFPVIACHCDKHGEAFPGEETIAALSGRTDKIVRQGIHDLEGFPGFSWERYLTRRGKRGKRFMIEFPPKGERGRAFFFHRGIIDAGIWRKNKLEDWVPWKDKQDRSGLISAAQALYPVMRYFSRYDADEDETLEDLSEFDERYADRRWELCSAEVGQLAKYAGINRHTVTTAIKSLQDNFLLEPYKTGTGEKAWKVFIIPKRYWKAGHLNQKLRSEAGA